MVGSSIGVIRRQSEAYKLIWQAEEVIAKTNTLLKEPDKQKEAVDLFLKALYTAEGAQTQWMKPCAEARRIREDAINGIKNVIATDASQFTQEEIEEINAKIVPYGAKIETMPEGSRSVAAVIKANWKFFLTASMVFSSVLLYMGLNFPVSTPVIGVVRIHEMEIEGTGLKDEAKNCIMDIADILGVEK